MEVVNSCQSVGFTKYRIIPPINWMTHVLLGCAPLSILCKLVFFPELSNYLSWIYLATIVLLPSALFFISIYHFLSLLALDGLCNLILMRRAHSS